MGSFLTFRAAAVGAVLVGSYSLATAGGASTAEARPIVLGCMVPAGAWPGHYGSIGNQQNGEAVCVVLGGKLLVSLSAPAGPGIAWRNIVVSPAGILTPAPMPNPVRPGVTGAGFLAKREGIVRISSYRRGCPATGAATASCDALISWKVTVVVRGPQRVLPRPEKVVRNRQSIAPRNGRQPRSATATDCLPFCVACGRKSPTSLWELGLFASRRTVTLLRLQPVVYW